MAVAQDQSCFGRVLNAMRTAYHIHPISCCDKSTTTTYVLVDMSKSTGGAHNSIFCLSERLGQSFRPCTCAGRTGLYSHTGCLPPWQCRIRASRWCYLRGRERYDAIRAPKAAGGPVRATPSPYTVSMEQLLPFYGAAIPSAATVGARSTCLSKTKRYKQQQAPESV